MISISFTVMAVDAFTLVPFTVAVRVYLVSLTAPALTVTVPLAKVTFSSAVAKAQSIATSFISAPYWSRTLVV